VVAHAGVISGHEDGVEHNAQRDEQVDERVHDEQLGDAGEALPACAALPVEQQLLYALLQYLLDARLASQPLTD